MVSSTPISASAERVRALAADVFVLGYPVVLTDTVRRAHPVKPGQILFLPDDPCGITPGLDCEDMDTVLTSTWLDVDREPVLLHVPEPHGRHFTLTFVGSYGQTIATFGPRSGHAAGGDFVVSRADLGRDFGEATPVVEAPSGGVWAITRILAHSPEDRKAARLAAAGQRVEPVGAPPGRQPEVCGMRALDPPALSCVQRVVEMPPETFVHRLAILLDRLGRNCGDDVREATLPILQALQTAQNAPSADVRRALIHGFVEGLTTLRAAADAAMASRLGEWRAAPRSGAVTPLERAVNAHLALGAPSPEEVLTLICRSDETGGVLQGSERYRIHFAPPVDGFWRLAVSPRGRGDDRSSIGSRDDLVVNPDGSLELILQESRPEAWPVHNWLPTPRRAFSVTLKMYGPRDEALEGTWRAPGLERLGSRFAQPDCGGPPFRPQNQPRRRTRVRSASAQEI